MKGERDTEGQGSGKRRQGPHRVLVLVGTRPEAIKMAPVVEALRRPGDEDLDVRVLLTGQHAELVDQTLEVFDLSPHWELGIMKEGQTLYDVADGCLRGVARVLGEWDPDLVLVQGDTATVFFSALASFFENAAVGHVEAGLRSGERRSPFPEELFRRLTAQTADLHFAPTDGARTNLLAEGVPSHRIWVTGNTVVDALLKISRSTGRARDPRVRSLLESPDPFVLVTAHRRESFGPPLEAVFRSLAELADTEGIRILFPVHPNPRVRDTAYGILEQCPGVTLTEPLSYHDLIRAMEGAAVILTDSGGIQEEAPTFGVPVLVLREVTERPEGIRAGVAELVGTDPDRILEACRRTLSRRQSAEAGAEERTNPYGDGRAGERIAAIVRDWLRTPAGTPEESNAPGEGVGGAGMERSSSDAEPGSNSPERRGTRTESSGGS